MDGQAHLGHGFDVHRVGHDEAERFRAVVERAGRQHRLEDFKKKKKNRKIKIVPTVAILRSQLLAQRLWRD